MFVCLLISLCLLRCVRVYARKLAFPAAPLYFAATRDFHHLERGCPPYGGSYAQGSLAIVFVPFRSQDNVERSGSALPPKPTQRKRPHPAAKKLKEIYPRHKESPPVEIKGYISFNYRPTDSAQDTTKEPQL